MNPVDHYAKLALLPGWIDYVRYQINQMEKNLSGLWVGLGQAIADRIKKLNDSNNIQS
jgi:hypothetical protein